MKNIDPYELRHATYNDNRVKDQKILSTLCPEDTLLLQLGDKKGKTVGIVIINIPDDHPDTALYTLYLSLEDMEYNDEYSHGHYDFSEDDDYEKGARNRLHERPRTGTVREDGHHAQLIQDRR